MVSIVVWNYGKLEQLGIRQGMKCQFSTYVRWFLMENVLLVIKRGGWMMNREEVKKAVLDLSPEDRFQLMLEIGPDLWRGIMERPGGRRQMMLRMMPGCREMMSKKMHAMAGTIRQKLSEIKRTYHRARSM